MTTVYVTEPNALVRKDGDTLLVEVPGDKAREKAPHKVRIPLAKVSQVVIQGNSTVTSPALSALLSQQVEVCFLSQHGQWLGRLSPAQSKNSLLRLAQFRAHDNPACAFQIARQMVAGKLANQRTMLLRSNRKRALPALAGAAARLKTLRKEVQSIATPTVAPDPSRPQKETAIGTLMGLEGAASAAYFGVFGQVLNEPWQFEQRVRRPPTDPVNALLSYAYTLLMHQVMAGLQVVGLDPGVGYLHSSQYGKPALALDLMEEFRPIIAESVVLSVLNNQILKASDFEETLGEYRLSAAGRRTFLAQFEQRLETEIRHPTFKYAVTYRRAITLQARLLGKLLMGELSDYPPFVVR